MDERIEIRQAAPDDVPALLRLMRGLTEHEGLPMPAPEAEERLRVELGSDSPRFEAVIAFRGGEPVGYASFFESFLSLQGLPALHLDDLFVVEGERGNGVGQALFDRAKSIARERGYSTMEWLAGDDNEGALRFYRRNGAETFAQGIVWLTVDTSD